MPKTKSGKLVPIGKRIKKVRTQKKITFDRMANETGLSTDYLKEIEAGDAIPPVGTLLQIARALDIDSEFFLKEDDSTQKKRQKAQTKRTDNYAYTTLTPGAENKHLKAFLVKIAAMQEHKGVGYQHDGDHSQHHLGHEPAHPGRVFPAEGDEQVPELIYWVMEHHGEHERHA